MRAGIGAVEIEAGQPRICRGGVDPRRGLPRLTDLQVERARRGERQALESGELGQFAGEAGEPVVPLGRTAQAPLRQRPEAGTQVLGDREEAERKIWESNEIPGGIVKEVKKTKKGNKVVAETITHVIRFHVEK